MATENTNTRYAVTFSGATDYTLPSTGPSAIDLELNSLGNAKDLLVVLESSSGAQRVLLAGTDYTVSGRTVTVTNTGLTGVKLVIIRTTPSTQTYDFTENEPFPASQFTSALDRLTFMVQTLQEQLDRIIKFPQTETVSGVDLPVAAERSGKILTFDESGNVKVADTFFQETIEGISSEDLGGGLTRVTFTFTSGATGSFTVPSVGGSTAPVANLYITNQTIAEDITVPADKNAMTVGPAAVGAGFTVDVETGATLVVIDQPGGL